MELCWIVVRTSVIVSKLVEIFTIDKKIKLKAMGMESCSKVYYWKLRLLEGFVHQSH